MAKRKAKKKSKRRSKKAKAETPAESLEPVSGFNANLIPDPNAPLSPEHEAKRIAAENAEAKKTNGKRLTRDDERAIAAWKKIRDDRLKWAYIKKFTKSDLLDMAQIHTTSLNRLADRLGVWTIRATAKHRARDFPVDLPQTIFLIFKWLSENHSIIDKIQSKENGESKDERTKREIELVTLQLKQMELAEKRDELISRDELTQTLSELGEGMRKMCETLADEYGDGASAIVEDYVRTVHREQKRLNGADDL